MCITLKAHHSEPNTPLRNILFVVMLHYIIILDYYNFTLM